MTDCSIQPTTLAQASGQLGVNPADIAILSNYIQQGKIARLQDRQALRLERKSPLKAFSSI